MYDQEFITQRLQVCRDSFKALWVDLRKEPSEISEPRWNREWFEQKSDSGFKIFDAAIKTARPPRAARDDGFRIYQEMFVAWEQSMRLVGSSSDSQTIKGYEQTIKGYEQLLLNIGIALNTLCLDLDAVEGGKPRYYFLQVKDAGNAMVTEWKGLSTFVDSWVRVDFVMDGKLVSVREDVKKLSQYSNEVVEEAEKAAKSCVIQEMRTSVTTLCRKLNTIRTTYDHMLCELDFLACLPELQPPFLSEMRVRIERAGYDMACAVRATAAITLHETNLVEQLQQDWHTIEQQVVVLQEEIGHWARRQLCTPPDSCQAAIKELRDCTREALRQVAMLRSDPACIEALDRQRESIKCVHTELIKLRGQTKHLEGFNQSVFDKFWWSTAHISQLLYQCPEEESPCLLTEKDLAEIVDYLKKKHADAGGQAIYLGMQAYGPQPGYTRPLGRPDPQVGQRVSDGESVRRGPFYMEMLKKLETLAYELEPKVPARLKARLARVIDEIQQQHCRVQASAGLGSAASARVLRQIAHRWHVLYASLSAIHILAKDSASAAQKKELSDWETRLSSLPPRTQDTIGYQPAFSEAMASERGVCAL